MSQVYNSGACFVYVGTGSSYAPVFLGTGERAPKRRTMRFWTPVMNDLAGDQEGFDDLYEGMTAYVMVRLTRWNQGVVDYLQSTPIAPGLPPGGVGPGTDVLGDVGTAMMTEGMLFPLWIVFDYGGAGRFPKAAMTGGGMAPGRHYFGTKLEGPDEETVGTQANFIDLVWKCKRVYDPTTGSFFLWDQNMTGIGPPN